MNLYDTYIASWRSWGAMVLMTGGSMHGCQIVGTQSVRGGTGAGLPVTHSAGLDFGPGAVSCFYERPISTYPPWEAGYVRR